MKEVVGKRTINNGLTVLLSEEKLTDGSMVYDVEIYKPSFDGQELILCNCKSTTIDEAMNLLDKADEFLTLFSPMGG